jgi:hypothetical protein
VVLRNFMSRASALPTKSIVRPIRREETRLDTLSEDLVGVVTRTVQPAHASLWLRPEPGGKGGQAD